MKFSEKIKNMQRSLQQKDIRNLKINGQYLFGVTAGVYYGFPICCITDFVMRMERSMFMLTDNQQRSNNGTGYIPCPNCADKIVSGKTTQLGLIKNRICEIDFPISTLEDEMESAKEWRMIENELVKLNNNLNLNYNGSSKSNRSSKRSKIQNQLR